jgi:tryptophanyl-tRNA synthetase
MNKYLDSMLCTYNGELLNRIFEIHTPLGAISNNLNRDAHDLCVIFLRERQAMTTRILSGIKPTGSQLHLGNEFGMNLRDSSSYDLMMIADLHALTNPDAQVNEWSYTLTAELMCLGYNGCLYRQSDIPEICELSWILSNLINKGYMDRMHAFKAAVGDVQMGLYTYAILMAADVLAVQATHVVVGQDQKQHLELTQILARRVVERYKLADFVYPEVKILSTIPLPGTDGRKMSKSYGNTIPAICTPEEFKERVYKIATNSLGPNTPKKPDTLYQIYAAFSTPAEAQELLAKYQQGISWKSVKDIVVEHLAKRSAGLHEKYTTLIQDKSLIERKWAESATRVREIARGVIEVIKSRM